MHLKEEFVSHTFASGIRVLQHAVVSPYKSTAVKLILLLFFFSPASFSSKKKKKQGRGSPEELEDHRRREMGGGDGEKRSGEHGQFYRTSYPRISKGVCKIRPI